MFERLRHRPIAERRILALSTYLSAAAVVIALWVSSFSETLVPLPPGAPSQILAGAPAEGPATATPPSELSSPFQALKEAAGATASHIRELAGAIESLRLMAPNYIPESAPLEPPPLPGNAKPEGEGSAHYRASSTPPSVAHLPPPRPAATSQPPAASGAAELLGQELDLSPPSAAALAELLAPPPSRQASWQDRARRILRDALGW